LGLCDRDGNARVALYTAPQGDSALTFDNEKGESRVILGFGSGEQAGLIISKPDGQVAAGILVDQEGAPSFVRARGN
jgi:hypothetical protein